LSRQWPALTFLRSFAADPQAFIRALGYQERKGLRSAAQYACGKSFAENQREGAWKNRRAL